MELVRRLILLGCVALALWTAKLASLSPLVSVEETDFAKLQEKESRWTDRGQYLAQLPREAYIQEVIKNRSRTVSGADWAEFFKDTIAAGRGEPTDGAWTERVGSDDLRWKLTPYKLFFKPGEAPLAAVADAFPVEGGEIFLGLMEGGRPTYLTLKYHRYDDGDFTLGSGFSGSPKPPATFLFPFRKYSLWIALIGLAAYILLPRRKRPPEALFYAGWRIILGDVAAMLLFTTFFGLPLFIIGGSLQVFSQAWPLALILWPLAFVGIWLLRFNAWTASYEILLVPGAIELSTYKEKTNFPFAAMTSYQPLVLRPPRWLIILSWLAALAGRGRQRIGAAGRALMIGGSAFSGVGVRMKDGSGAYFWVTDQMGGQALKNAQRMLQMFENAGVPRLDKTKVIESITLPTGEDAQGHRIREGGGRSLGVLFLLPIAAIVTISLILAFGRPHSTIKAADAVSSTGTKTNEATKGEPLSDPDAVWTTPIGKGDISIGQAIVRTSDGGFAVAGYASTGGTDLDFLLAKVDAAGRLQWEKTYPGELREYGLFVCPASDGGFFVLGESRPADDLLGGGRDVLLIKTDPSGDKLWEKTWGQAEQDDVPLALAPGNDGDCRTLIRTPSSVDLLVWDAGGTVIKHEKRVILSQFEEPENIKAAAFAPGGGFVLTGEERKQGASFVDLFMAKFDARGEIAWKQVSGGPGKESGVAVIPLKDGGFAAAGVVNVFDESGENVYLLRTDARGDVQGEYSHGGAGDQSGAALLETEDGNFIVVGTFKEGDAPVGIYTVTIIPGRNEKPEKRIAGGPYGAEGAAVAQAGDGGYVIVANRTTTWMGAKGIELIKIAKR
ncbi:MAG: hypothetical protein NTU60_10860 [Candidatus Aminicenantes bacterium]|nr:hypothetical protein [Candidatus Aminicenantes bacterium]